MSNHISEFLDMLGHRIACVSVVMAALLLLCSPVPGLPTMEMESGSRSAATVLPAVPPAGTAIPLSAGDCALLGLPATGAGQCVTDTTSALVVAISTPEESEHAGTALLATAGYTGDPGDGREAIYAPVGLALFDELGSWTVTVGGLVRCEHGAVPCTGREALD